jgi:SAM-dependent methyltransferase
MNGSDSFPRLPDNTPRFSLWWAGMTAGIRTVAREPVLGLKRLLLPVSYWRSVEFGYVVRRLGHLPAGARLLDLGSPKDLAGFLARRLGAHVTAVDLLPDAIAISERFARAQGIAGGGAGQVLSEVQDGRRLPYPDASFDAAFSVSVLEHIPDDGDSTAMRELLRVVKPGGLVVVTTPFDLQYRETMVDADVYDRTRSNETEKLFFERHYDEPSLRRRLLEAAPADLLDVQFWGEGFVRGERLLARLGGLRNAFSPLEAAMASAWLRRVQPGNGVHPMAVFFTLRKPNGAYAAPR